MRGHWFHNSVQFSVRIFLSLVLADHVHFLFGFNLLISVVCFLVKERIQIPDYFPVLVPKADSGAGKKTRKKIGPNVFSYPT